MSDMKGLIGTMSRKWKIDQNASKKLEIENKLMEERLNQLKSDLNREKEIRSARGGVLWSRGQSGPMASYAKNVLHQHKANMDNNILSKPTKLKILKDEPLPAPPPPKGHRNALNREKTIKCGQCEKKVAFVHCVECCEDYCINCFSSFHAKGALKKHRSLPITSEGRIKTPIIDVLTSPTPGAENKAYETNNSSRKSSSNASDKQTAQKMLVQQSKKVVIVSARNGSAGSEISGSGDQMYEANDGDYRENRNYSGNYNSYGESLEQDEYNYENYENGNSSNDMGIGTGVGGGSLLDGRFDENESHEAFKRAVLEWRNGGAKSANVNTPSVIMTNNENKKSKTAVTSNKVKKHADASTDNGELTMQDQNSSIKTLQNIEMQINFNHSLSYAERLLLKKYRRTDVEEFFNVNTNDFPNNTNDKNSYENSSNITKSSIDVGKSKDNSQNQNHIDFNQLMRVLQVDSTNNANENDFHNRNTPSPLYIQENNYSINDALKETNSANYINQTEVQKSMKIEEVLASTKDPNFGQIINKETLNQTSNNKEKTNLSLNLTENNVEKLNNDKKATQQQTKTTKNTSSRPNSSRLNSARQLNSSRPSSRQAKASIQQKVQFESNLTKSPSDLLKSIANRELPSQTINNTEAMGEYFLLTVEKIEVKNDLNKQEANSIRPPSVNKTHPKVSNQLYEMAPRSWRPSSSLSTHNNENTITKIDSNVNNIKIMHASIEAKDYLLTPKQQDQQTTQKQQQQQQQYQKFDNEKQQAINKVKNSFLANSSRQSSSSSLTIVSKDYETATTTSAALRQQNEINRNSNNNSKILNESINEEMPLPKATKIQLNNSIASSSTASSINKKPEKKNDTIEFNLSKGMKFKSGTPINSTKSSINQKITTKQSDNNVNYLKFSKSNSRPSSMLSRCQTPSNPRNIEVAEEFSTYDDDDGRSSRFCQNEEDDVYFQQLGREFKEQGNVSFDTGNMVPQNIDINNIMKLINKKEMSAADFNEMFTSNLSSLERTLRDEEDQCTPDLDLEDLKLLK